MKLKIKLRRRKYNLILSSVAVSASLILVFTFADLFSGRSEIKDNTSPVEVVVESFPEMGGKKAILTLHTGEKIDLTKSNGKVIAEDDVLLHIDPNESINYKKGNQNAGGVLKYNSPYISYN